MFWCATPPHTGIALLLGSCSVMDVCDTFVSPGSRQPTEPPFGFVGVRGSPERPMLSLGTGEEGRVWPGQSSSCVAVAVAAVAVAAVAVAAVAVAAVVVGCAFWPFWGQFRETTFFSPTGSRKFARRRAGNGWTQNFAARLAELVK